MEGARRVPGDWHPGTVPQNVLLDGTAYLESTYSLLLYRSEETVGLRLGRAASVYLGTMFDLGQRGSVLIGDYALVLGAWIMCDSSVEIGDYALISWNVVLMDSYRLPLDPAKRRRELRRLPYRSSRRIGAQVPARPIRVGANVWIGFDSCVLPGVSIGEGSIVGARSVVDQDVEPYTIVGGNPARLIRRLDEQGAGHGA
jgi:acetyltransferase-like isoleucine patch superfamily enzyme